MRGIAKLVLLAIGGTCNVSDRRSGEYSTTSFSSFQALLKLTCGTTEQDDSLTDKCLTMTCQFLIK
ncbi:MAG: hypothetical protein ABR909_02010 [Candidatus Bathyarchaeia archaeon]